MDLTVGQAARRSGLSAKAVRLYEARGLLPPPGRTAAGYRRYSERDVAMLRFIRRARGLGLRLAEIKAILDLERAGAQPCAAVLALLDQHLRELDRTMADLRALRAALVRARASETAIGGGDAAAVVCRIIEAGAPAD